MTNAEQLRGTVLDRVLHDGLQGKSRHADQPQIVRNIEFDHQLAKEARLFDFEIGRDVCDLFTETGFLAWPLEIVAKEGRQIEDQVAGSLGVAANHCRQGVEGIEQEVRIDLGMQQLDFRLRQQLALTHVSARQDLIGKQARDAFAECPVDGGKKAGSWLVELDRADDAAFLAYQGDDERGRQRAFRIDRATVGYFVAVGVHNFVALDGLEGQSGMNGRSRQVVSAADTDESQQVLGIGDGHCADAGFLIDDTGDQSAGVDVEAGAQQPLDARRNTQRLGGKNAGLAFVELATIEQNAHEQRRTQRIGDQHGDR